MDYNFFESSAKKPKKNSIVFIVLIAIFALAFAVMGVITILYTIDTNAKKTEIAAKEQEMNISQAKIKSLEEKEALMNDIALTAEFFIATDTAAINNRTVNTAVFDYITAQVPEGLVLTSLTISNRTVSLEGKSWDYMDIPLFQDRLNEVKVKGTDNNAFTDLTVPAIERVDEDNAQTSYRFTMQLSINFNVDSGLSVSLADIENQVAFDDNDKEVIIR